MKKRRWPLSRDNWREWKEWQRAIDAGVRASLRGYRRAYPRSEEPWQLAEDRRLLRLVRKYSPKLKGIKLWITVGRALKRTSAAVQNRHHALLAGMRVARHQ